MRNNGKLRLDDQLCFALYAATNAVTRAYRPLLREINLTYPQYLVMLVLWQDGDGPTGHIANRLSLPPNAVTPLLDRLEANGFVKRQRDGNDRRIVHVTLTPEGAALERAAAQAQADVECRTLLKPDDLATLRQELKELVERMEPHIGAEAGDPSPQPEFAR